MAPESNFAPLAPHSHPAPTASQAPSAPPEGARTWVEVDLSALVRNAHTIQTAVSRGTRLLPMVKADAYGLGAVRVARALEPLKPWGYGVATAEEGRQLRDSGIVRPILVLSPLVSELAELARLDLTPALGALEQVRAWLSIAGADKPFHVQVDTGMCRAGFWWEAFGAAQSAFSGAPGFEGAFTHFHSAESNPASVREQVERFQAALATLPRRPRMVHAANSAAALLHPGETSFDLVRPGIYLYGGRIEGAPAPDPVVAWKARIVEVNRRAAGVTVSYGATWTAPAPVALATLAVGYADGLRRSLSGSGEALVGGRRLRMAGRVTMDLTVVASNESLPVAGGIATLIGADGGEEITLDAMAAAAGTVSYEILTGLSPRVARVYL